MKITSKRGLGEMLIGWNVDWVKRGLGEMWIGWNVGGWIVVGWNVVGWNVADPLFFLPALIYFQAYIRGFSNGSYWRGGRVVKALDC